jgi:hypothetical protein
MEPNYLRPQDYAEISATRVLDFFSTDFGASDAIHNGPNHDFDISMYKLEKLVGVCQVKFSIDGVRQSREMLFRDQIDRTTELPEGKGSWYLQLSPRVKIKSVHPKLGDFVSQLHDLGIKYWQPWMGMHDELEEISQFGKSLGVEDAHLMEHSSGSNFTIAPDVTFGSISGEPPFIAPWIEGLVEKHINSFKSIAALEVKQKHLFVWVGSGTPAEIFLSSQFHRDKAPADFPRLPEWVTDLWIGIPWIDADNQLTTWHYSVGGAWDTKVVPNWILNS